MSKIELPEGFNIRQLEEELDYLENADRTIQIRLPDWLMPAFLICTAAILFMH